MEWSPETIMSTAQGLSETAASVGGGGNGGSSGGGSR